MRQPARNELRAVLLDPGNFDGGGLQAANSSVMLVMMAKETILFIFYLHTFLVIALRMQAEFWRASATAIGVIYRRWLRFFQFPCVQKARDVAQARDVRTLALYREVSLMRRNKEGR